MLKMCKWSTLYIQFLGTNHLTQQSDFIKFYQNIFVEYYRSRIFCTFQVHYFTLKFNDRKLKKPTVNVTVVGLL